MRIDALAQHLDLLVGGPADAKDDVGLARTAPGASGTMVAPGLAVRLVGVRGRLAGAGLDEHLDAVARSAGRRSAGVRATRVSPSAVSRGTAIFIGSSLCEGHAHGEPPQLIEGAWRFGGSECSRTDGSARDSGSSFRPQSRSATADRSPSQRELPEQHVPRRRQPHASASVTVVALDGVELHRRARPHLRPARRERRRQDDEHADRARHPPSRCRPRDLAGHREHRAAAPNLGLPARGARPLPEA